MLTSGGMARFLRQTLERGSHSSRAVLPRRLSDESVGRCPIIAIHRVTARIARPSPARVARTIRIGQSASGTGAGTKHMIVPRTQWFCNNCALRYVRQRICEGRCRGLVPPSTKTGFEHDAPTPPVPPREVCHHDRCGRDSCWHVDHSCHGRPQLGRIRDHHHFASRWQYPGQARSHGDGYRNCRRHGHRQGKWRRPLLRYGKSQGLVAVHGASVASRSAHAVRLQPAGRDHLPDT